MPISSEQEIRFRRSRRLRTAGRWLLAASLCASLVNALEGEAVRPVAVFCPLVVLLVLLAAGDKVRRHSQS